MSSAFPAVTEAALNHLFELLIYTGKAGALHCPGIFTAPSSLIQRKQREKQKMFW